MLTTTAVTTIAWIAATFLTRPAPASTLESFYRRVRPGGAGWHAVAERIGYGREPIAGGALSWVNWVAGVVSVYATLFGVGKLLFGPRLHGFLWLALAALAFWWIAFALSRPGSFATPVTAGEDVSGVTA